MSERFIEIVKKCNIARRNMEVKNLRQAKAKCPYCDGHYSHTDTNRNVNQYRIKYNTHDKSYSVRS